MRARSRGAAGTRRSEMGILDFVFGSGDKIFGGAKESDEERSAKLENG